jgi:PKD domain/RTX calcium-binding nonapeptide repeat (4 copies)
MRPDWLRRRMTKALTRPRPYRPTLERLEDKLAPAIFTVTNTNDGGPGSLRQAMFDAESTPNGLGPDEVHFAIPDPGVQVIRPSGTLPVIVDPVIIDGYTQPGASPNTLAVGDNAVLLIEINGSGLSSFPSDLFHFGGDGSTVRGLAVTHVPGTCFDIGKRGVFTVTSNNHTIVGNFIGTDAGGSTYLADHGVAILIGHGNTGVVANGNRIGGTAPADRNVITSDGAGMIVLQDAHDNLIQGNYIGVNKDGTAPLRHPVASLGVGIAIGTNASSNTIGGTTAGAGNVIFGAGTGIVLSESSAGNHVVQGNFIGTNAAGTAGLGGGTGIFVNTLSGVGDLIGGTTSGAGNLISGNTTGIVSATGSPGPTIQGNKIGTDATGTSAVPNSGDGIIIGVRGPGPATIGGTGPGEGNTIAFNGGNGIQMSNGAGRSFLGNSIFSNFGLGIDLQSIGDPFQVTLNDPGDGDTGANGLQNYPVITSAELGSGQVTISGTVNSTPSTVFRLEFFASEVVDPSGFGEGQTFLGFTTVTTDAAGDSTFDVAFPQNGGTVISATATDPAGNTSEFSFAVTAASVDVIIDANTTQNFLDSLTAIHGSLIMVGVAGRTDLHLPNLTQVDGDFIVTGNPDLTALDAPLLASVGGDVDVSDNPALTSINLGGVTSVGGSLSVNDNTAATGVDLGSVTTVDGSLSVNGNTAATGIDLGNVTSVGGSLSVNDNTAATGVDLSSVTSVGGNLSVSGNTAATGVDVGSVTTVNGSVNVSGNTAATGIDLGSVTTVTGNVNINGNTSATGVDVGSLTTVNGNLSISGNTSATGVDVGNLNTVDGAVNISGNTSASGVEVGSLTTVGGGLMVDNNSSATNIDLGSLTSVNGQVDVSGNIAATNIDLGRVTVTPTLNISGDVACATIDIRSLQSADGSISINGDVACTTIDIRGLESVGGSVSITGDVACTTIDLSALESVGGDPDVEAGDSVSAVTANGDTRVNLFSAAAQMTADLAHGTFADPVKFTVSTLAPTTLPPEPGEDSGGAAATIDPLAAYRFAFAIPTLGQNAELTFEINVAALSSADRNTFLTALASGQATVAVKNDTPGSLFQAFALAAPGQPPTANSVTLTRLGADHKPLPPGSTATPTFVRFEGITGHFSTFAVVTVSPSGNNAPVVTSLTGPTHGVPGQPLHYAGAFIDPDADSWTATVNFGDGTGNQPLALNPDKTFAFDHVFASPGTSTMVVTVADNNGGLGTRSLTVVVVAAGLESDPLDPSHPMLVVRGTSGDDAILISRDGGNWLVSINGTPQGTFTTAGRIVVYGQDGNDDLQVDGGIANAAWLYGGAGNDRLKGGGGDDALLGGAGDDLLVGGNGRDFMDGGVGADRLVGNAGDDILLAGSTAFEDNELALRSIQAEWTSTRDYATRVANLQGTGSGPRNSGGFFLTVDGPTATAFDDGAEDILTGSAGADWFFANLDAGVKDKITALSAGEFANDLDFSGP